MSTPIPFSYLQKIYSDGFARISYPDEAGTWHHIFPVYEEQKPKDITVAPTQSIGVNTVSVSGTRKKLNWRYEQSLSFKWDNFMSDNTVPLREGLTSVSSDQILITQIDEFLKAAAQGREIRFAAYAEDLDDYISGFALFDSYALEPSRGYKLFTAGTLKFTISYDPE